MGDSNEDIIKAILHYQERLEKYNANKSEDKMLYALRKLSKLPIKTSHLESTGVGRTVNALKKLTGAVGDSAKNLVMSWKEMVLEEEKATQETSIETEEDADSVYSSENESQDLQMEEGKENVNNQSDSESDSEDYSYKKEIPSKNQNYLENKTSKYKDHKKHDNYSSTNSNSDDNDDDDDEAETNSHFRKREHSTDSSSDERGRHKSKKSKRESESSSRHRYKDKYTKDEKDKKYDRHSSSSKSKNNEDRSESKHKPKRESEQSNHKLEKYSKHEENDKKSSHSSKHKSSSSHSSKKECKDKKEKDKHESKRESSSSHSSEKKLKESSKEEKKKSKDSHSGSNSQSMDKSTNGENGVKKEKKEKVKSISKEKIINGIDSESGASFAEALGMCGPVSSHSIKKKTSSTDKKSVKPVETKPSESSRSSSKTSKHEESSSSSSSSSRPVPELLVEEPREPLNICLSSLLPEITPNYKPTPINLDSQSKKFYNDDEALSRVMSNKNQRTKVYSGNKTVGKVESLFQLCVRILQDNIDALEYTGGVPFLILKPILDRATPDQLFNMEHHNPYLIEDTDDLWQLHCQKEFRTKKREELESWREMYMRCLDEREARLSFITANIKQSQDKSEPVRTTKLAYVDSGFVKPPRNIARKQAKNGTVTTDRKITPTQKLSVIAKSGDTEKIAHPNPSSRATERTSNSSSAATKPKKAPLMAKTLSFLKNRFKR